MKKLIQALKKLFYKVKPCNPHEITEGWMVQQLRYRECLKCGTREYVRGKEYKILTKENCIYYDGEQLTY